MFGATSPDGMRWKPVAEPLALHCSDTANNAYYDVTLQKYVWYGRINSWYERRCIARSETDDFRRFPFPRIIVRPDAGEEPWKDWYTNAKTVYPGTSSQHLMFPAQFRRIDEASEIHLFSSADGIYWDHVPGGPVIVQGPHGRPGDTWLRAWRNLVDLSEDRVGLMCDAELLPHKYPRRAGNRHREVNRPTTFWATWPKGRLSAIQAEEYGSFQAHQLKIRGRKLLLNFETKRAAAGGNYGYSLMWVFVLCLVLRWLFVSIIAKHQLCNQHGENVLGGLIRLHPLYGPFILVSALMLGHADGLRPCETVPAYYARLN